MSSQVKAICTALGVVLGGTAFWLTPRTSEGPQRTHPAPPASPPQVAASPPPSTPAPSMSPLRVDQKKDQKQDQEKEETATTPVESQERAPAQAVEPAPRPHLTGVLSVNVSPRYANVYVDGKLRGQTPLEVSLPVGKHKIVIEDPEDPSERSSSAVTIRANETTLLRKSLSPGTGASDDSRRP